MNFTEFFIKHRVISIIINVMILIIGFLAFRNIIVREYPDIKLPIVSIMTPYPNANAELIESSVTNILEDQISGIQKIKSISSESSFGISRIFVHFEEGTIIDNVIVDIREAIGKAKSQMPKEVLESDIHRGGGFGGVPFFAISISSDKVDFTDLTHYARRYLKNSFRSVKGVSTTQVWGRPHSMIITLNPKKMYNYGINVHDVIENIKGQNIALPTGNYRDSIPSSLDLRLETEEDFEKTYIGTKNGKAIYLKDIAEVKLGVDPKENRTKVNGKSGVVISIERASDSNALDVANALKEKVEQLRENIPSHMKINIEIDQSIFIDASISNIKSSIIEAVILVLLIVFLFLGSFTSTIIPLITVPISLMGSVAVMLYFGMSLNVFTLLAMVLAIGLVVDDSIVVLENITRHIENGLKPMEAAIKGSSEIFFAIIAMTLTLASVYAPVAFVKGIAGQMFVEFAVTLSGAVIISGIAALTLSPMMCAYIIRPHKENRFQKFLHKIESIYARFLHIIFYKPLLIIGIVISSLLISYLSVKFSHNEILPREDRSLMGIYVPPQPGKNLDDMEKYADQMTHIIKDIPEKENYLTFIGNWGLSMVAPLKEHKQRSRTQSEIVASIEPLAKEVPTIDVWPWGYDSGILDMGSVRDASNVTFALQSTESYKELSDMANKLNKALNESGKFIYVMQDTKFDSAKYDIKVNKVKFSDLSLNPLIFSREVGAFFSGNQELKFTIDDIKYPITILGKSNPWSLNELYLTDNRGNKTSLGSVAKMEEKVSMSVLKHYNQMRAANFTGMPMPPHNVESAMPIVNKIFADNISKSFTLNWTGSAQMTEEASNTMGLLFMMAVIFIYAILAIQFNSFIDPVIIMFTVPLACAGALFINKLLGLSINVYSQIGLITLVGLITKHGILIVEFANKLHAEGEDLTKAILYSAKLRLRPILMTTGAMILGIVPLVISSGAGSEARYAIGIILVSGLAFGTFFTLFVLPKIYFWIKRFSLPR